MIRLVEPDIVRHEGFGSALDDRMPCVGDDELSVVPHLRFDVVAARRHLGQRRQDVERRQRPSATLDPVRRQEDPAPQRVENLLLPVQEPFVRPERLLFVVLQRRRDVALAGRDGLLAVVVVRDGVQIGRRHLDVVAEDPVEADLQGRDPGPLPLRRLHGCNRVPGIPADGAQLVQLVVEAVPDRPAVARERRRVVGQRRGDPVVDVTQLVEPVEQHADERRLQLGRVGARSGDDADGAAECGQIARSRRAQRHAPDETLQILDARQVRPQPAAGGDLP